MANVTGPASSTDTAIARWNGTSGTVIQDSSVLIDSSNNVTGINSISSDGGDFTTDGSGNVTAVSMTLGPATIPLSVGAGAFEVDGSGNTITTGYVSAASGTFSGDCTAATIVGDRIKSSNGKIDTDESTGTLVAVNFLATQSPPTGNNLILAAGSLTQTVTILFNASNATTDFTLTGDASLSGTNTGDQTMSFGVTIDGNGSTPATGFQGIVTIPYDGTITNWYIVSDVSGSAVIDIKRSGSSIIGTGNAPTLSSASSANAAVSGWTSDTVSTGDIITFNLNSASTLTYINLVLAVTP